MAQENAQPKVSSSPHKNLEFPALSQKPRVNCTMPLNNPVDQMVPEKFSPHPPEQDEESEHHKDPAEVIPKTEEIIKNGYKQVRHAKAITLELKLLLEHEQKILQQIVTRIDKFKNLRDENKRKAMEWENEYKGKLPQYDAYSTKLVNVPQTQTIPVEGLPAPIQQKILYQIVSRTSNTADRVVVSLSMEQTVANDIDLTLGSLKKQCAVILKRIRGWLKMLETHECQQTTVLERFEKYKDNIKEMKKQSDQRTLTGIGSTMSIANQLKPYEDRIRRLEEAVCNLAPQYGTCPKDKGGKGGKGGAGGKSSEADKDERLRKIEQALCQISPASGFCPGGPGSTSSKGERLPPQNDQESRLRKIEEAICQMWGICDSGQTSQDCDPTDPCAPQGGQNDDPCPPPFSRY